MCKDISITEFDLAIYAKKYILVYFKTFFHQLVIYNILKL